MGLLNWLRGPAPLPAAASKSPQFALALAAAPAFHPLPVMPTTSADIAVSRAWLQFQQQKSGLSWDAFLAALRAENDDLAAEIKAVTHEIASYK